MFKFFVPYPTQCNCRVVKSYAKISFKKKGGFRRLYKSATSHANRNGGSGTCSNDNAAWSRQVCRQSMLLTGTPRSAQLPKLGDCKYVVTPSRYALVFCRRDVYGSTKLITFNLFNARFAQRVSVLKVIFKLSFSLLETSTHVCPDRCSWRAALFDCLYPDLWRGGDA